MVQNLVEKSRRKYVESGFEKKKWESAKGALICRLHLEFDAFEKHPIVSFSSCIVKTARRAGDHRICSTFYDQLKRNRCSERQVYI